MLFWSSENRSFLSCRARAAASCKFEVCLFVSVVLYVSVVVGGGILFTPMCIGVRRMCCVCVSHCIETVAVFIARLFFCEYVVGVRAAYQFSWVPRGRLQSPSSSSSLSSSSIPLLRARSALDLSFVHPYPSSSPYDVVFSSWLLSFSDVVSVCCVLISFLSLLISCVSLSVFCSVSLACAGFSVGLESESLVRLSTSSVLRSNSLLSVFCRALSSSFLISVLSFFSSCIRSEGVSASAFVLVSVGPDVWGWLPSFAFVQLRALTAL